MGDSRHSRGRRIVSPPPPGLALYSVSRPGAWTAPCLPAFCAAVPGTTTTQTTSAQPTATGTNPTTATTISASELPARLFAGAGGITVPPGVHRAYVHGVRSAGSDPETPDERSGPCMMTRLGSY